MEPELEPDQYDSKVLTAIAEPDILSETSLIHPIIKTLP